MTEASAEQAQQAGAVSNGEYIVQAAAVAEQAGDDLVDIVIQSAIAGPDFSWRPGQTITLPRAEAARWADGERATWAPGHGPTRETTAAPAAPERTDGGDAPAGPAEQPGDDDQAAEQVGDEAPVEHLAYDQGVTPEQVVDELLGDEAQVEQVDADTAAQAKKATAKKATPAKKATAR